MLYGTWKKRNIFYALLEIFQGCTQNIQFFSRLSFKLVDGIECVAAVESCALVKVGRLIPNKFQIFIWLRSLNLAWF